MHTQRESLYETSSWSNVLKLVDFIRKKEQLIRCIIFIRWALGKVSKILLCIKQGNLILDIRCDRLMLIFWHDWYNTGSMIINSKQFIFGSSSFQLLVGRINEWICLFKKFMLVLCHSYNSVVDYCFQLCLLCMEFVNKYLSWLTIQNVNTDCSREGVYLVNKQQAMFLYDKSWWVKAS